MRLLEDGIIAALAAVGLITLLMLLLSALVHPRRPRGTIDALAVVPCGADDGEKLEYTVRTLTRARYEYGGFRRIVILDRGMDGEARKIAALLCRDGFDVSVCSREQLTQEWE